MWQENGKPKIMVGMSGGVDSSVAAALLLDQGYDVAGAFMKNWSETKDPKTGECAWKEERRDAMRVAADLAIPFVTFDFEQAYDEAVVQYLYREYAAGRTPNPDVMCNRAIKFDLFLKAALAEGADAIATGHYARVEKRDDGTCALLAGLDRAKDQSYFVFSLVQEQLRRVLFPVGHLCKQDVRAYARERGIFTAEKKDSQGICFIGKVELRDFLKRALKPKPGNIITVAGAHIGTHHDVQAFTIGQRHGLGLSGGPWFVVATDVGTGTVIVAQGSDHPALFKKKLRARECHWVSGRVPAFPFQCWARIRYRQSLQACEVFQGEGDSIEVCFAETQRAVTPGQFVVFYEDEKVLGGGVIED